MVYRRYASLFFGCGISQGDNELVVLEVIHRYVEVLDRYFGNVRVDITFCAARALTIVVRSASLICTVAASSRSGKVHSLITVHIQHLQLPEGVCCESRCLPR